MAAGYGRPPWYPMRIIEERDKRGRSEDEDRKKRMNRCARQEGIYRWEEKCLRCGSVLVFSEMLLCLLTLLFFVCVF